MVIFNNNCLLENAITLNNFSGQCSVARKEMITVKECCCSMGAAWGRYCEQCPAEETGMYFHIFCFFYTDFVYHL